MYNVQDWYWIVDEKYGLVYSSRRAGYFPADDSEYAAWIESGNLPTRIDTEANLIGVFGAQYPAGWPDLIRAKLTITARQFFIALAQAQYITATEAIAAAQTGAIPANIQAVFDALPPEDSITAIITWAKMTEVNRTEPLVAACAAAMGLTDAEVDAFFEMAAQI